MYKNDNFISRSIDENEILRMDLALSVAQFGIWDWDVPKNILVWDDQLYAMYGLAKEKFSGTLDAWAACVHPDDIEKSRANVENALAGGADLEDMFRVVWPDKSIHYIRARGKVIFDQEHKPKRMIGINWDVTKEVELQKTLEHERVNMIQSAKMATLGEMAAGIAHEINNPLTIIVGLTAQLQAALNKQHLDLGSFKATLTKITQTSGRIAKIIQGMRAFARDQKDAIYENVNVKQIIMETLDFCNTRLQSNKISLNLEGIDENLFLECKPINISQIILNLLSNSLDALLDTNSPWIKIEAFEKNGYVIIRVTDSGKGIDPQLLEKIMQPFFTTKPPGKGTGLGLSISLGIAQAHHGRFYIDSTLENTCFVLELPKKQPNPKKKIA